MVLDDTVIECSLSDGESTGEFLKSLSVGKQPRSSLLTLYQGWIDCMHAYKAANITGRFTRVDDGDEATIRQEALVEYDRLTSRIAATRSQAERESQINRRVELNLEIRGLEAQLAEAKAKL